MSVLTIAISGCPTHAILTRLRQKGNPCAMMLMLNILSTLCGGKASETMSLGSARSNACFSNGTFKLFSFPQAAFGIFFRAPAEEKPGIGQCRSIAKKSSGLKGHIPEERFRSSSNSFNS